MEDLFGNGLRNKQTASGKPFTDNSPDARPPPLSEDTRYVGQRTVPLCCLTLQRQTSHDVVYTVVPTSFNPASAKEPPVRPAAVSVIDRYACASMVRY